MTPPGIVLIIAEKPQAARRIAEALSGGRGTRRRIYGVTCWEFPCRLGRCVVAPSVGHLYGLHAPPGPPPVFAYEWRPIWLVEKGSSYARKYFNALRSLCSRARLYINACDYDIEGSLIGYLIIKFLGDPRRAKRMKFSTLTREDIVRAFNNLEPLDYPMIEAGRARHILDWLWGINVSRLLMEAVRRAGRRVILSAGRVQSPTLLEVVRRDLSCRLHVPMPSFVVEAVLRLPGGDVKVKLSPVFTRRSEADSAAAGLRRRKGMVVEFYGAETRHLPPPPPFNLGDLQAEAARIYGMSPYTVQRIAEQLYLDALISYPRTDSQVIPPTIDVAKIVHGLSKQPTYRPLVSRLLRETGGVLRPRRGRKTDPAHPAIHPTGLAPERRLTREEQRVYDLVVRRFLASMAKPARVESVTLKLRSGVLVASLTGLRVLEAGWLEYYPFSAPREKAVPRLRRGEVVPVRGVRVVTQYSSRPSRYSKASLVKWMERVNIGTKSTRARIVELLVKRGYVKQQRGGLRVTDLGYAVARALERFVPKLVSVELTREFESMLEAIMMGRLAADSVIESAKKVIASIIESVNEEKLRIIGYTIAAHAGLIEPGEKCAICRRPVAGDGLCELHQAALSRLREAEGEWRTRTGKSREEYLESICKMKMAGELVRDVACWLLEKRSR